jgi:hypothetical protein
MAGQDQEREKAMGILEAAAWLGRGPGPSHFKWAIRQSKHTLELRANGAWLANDLKTCAAYCAIIRHMG